MDFGLNEVGQILRKSARDFLTAECPKSLVRQMIEDEKGYVPAMWKKMAELGWMGLVFPEQYDGGDGDFLDLAVLLEEIGRACLPGPFFSTVVLSGMTILTAGSEEQKARLLPEIARGDSIATLALTESGASYSAEGITVEATTDGDAYNISGTKLFVPDAHVADYIICVARTEKSNAAEDGITLFLVSNKTPGVNCNLLKTMAGDKQCEVIFNNVRVSSENILGEINHGWPHIKTIMNRAAVGKCAEMVGGAQQVLEMTVDHVKQRVQFGRPVGSFQSIQNYCVQIMTDVETSRLITYEAAWRISEGLSCDKEVSMAKSWVSDAYKRITALGHQSIGGVAYMVDHDMHLYLTRAKAAEMAFGDADYQRELVAQELGL